MEREGLGSFELLVIVVAGAGFALVGAIWTGAWLALVASGEIRRIPFAAAADAAPRLPVHLGSPGSQALPGASLYWLCTALTTAALIAVAAVVLRWLTGSKVGTARRRPLGV